MDLLCYCQRVVDAGEARFINTGEKIINVYKVEICSDDQAGKLSPLAIFEIYIWY